MFENLESCKLFKSLTRQDINEVFGSLHYQKKTFKPGSILASAGEKCTKLIIIANGSVRGEMSDFSGKTIKIEDIEAPDTVASAFLFGNRNEYPVDIVANTMVGAIIISKESLIRLFQANAIILSNYLDIISNRAQFLSRKIRFLSFKTIKGKIAHYIIQHGGKNLDEVELPISQTELAVFFGVTRPALARAFHEMAAEGILAINRRMIRITNRQKLVALMSN